MALAAAPSAELASRTPVVVAVRPGAAAELASRHLGIEVVQWCPGGTRPPGLRADIVLGAAMADESLLPWITDATWVHATGVGIDGLLPELTAGRVVTNSPGANAIALAEFAFGSVLAAAKWFPEVWDAPLGTASPLLDVVHGRTIGLIGYGNIGTAVAARARAFDMQVIVHRQKPSPDADGVRFVSRPELARLSDHIVLAAPATPNTHHLVDAAFLARTKPGVHLVNVARGSLIDQEALRSFLDAGHVSRATLDTVEPEPVPEGHWLRTHPRVKLSPHIAQSSPHSLREAVDGFVENLHRYLAGLPLQNVALDNR